MPLYKEPDKTISRRYKMAKPHKLVMDSVIEDRK
jgi:hypothetical protein